MSKKIKALRVVVDAMPREDARDVAALYAGMPPSIQVGAVTYVVEAHPRLQLPDGSGTANGLTDLERNTITVNSENLSAEQARETLCHELIHAVLGVVRCDVVLGMSVDGEERLVSTLAPILSDTLRRNPDLVEYLFRSN